LVDILFPDGEKWAEQLRSIATKSFPANVAFTAEGLLTSVRAGVTQLDPPTDADFVRVMSLHKSKGLTARVVIVMGCIEGMIPDVDYKLSPKAQEGMREEQRRLFYVALTRPTETLMLSSVTYIPMDQALGMGLPGAQVMASSFLGELGPDKPKPLAGHTLL
jgi:superfamily I DNA/RNA helicase